MNGLLSVVIGWLKFTPLPDVTEVRAEIVGGGRFDGGQAVACFIGPVSDGATCLIDGERYRLEWRNGRRVLRYLRHGQIAKGRA